MVGLIKTSERRQSIDILAEDYPEIVTALRGCVEAMLKEVPK